MEIEPGRQTIKIGGVSWIEVRARPAAIDVLFDAELTDPAGSTSGNRHEPPSSTLLVDL